MVAIADLNLVGAVGIRVRPDARGFKRETKAEVMSQLQGLEGAVPISPELQEQRAELKAQLERMVRGLKSEAEVKVRLDDSRVRKDAERVKRSLNRFKDVKLDVEARTARAQKAIDELAIKAETLNEEYDKVNAHTFDEVSEASRKLKLVQDDLRKSAEKLSKQEEALSRARSSSAAASAKSMRDHERALKSFEAQTEKLRESEERLERARKAVSDSDTKRSRRELELATNAVAKATERLSDAQERLARTSKAKEESEASNTAKRARAIRSTTLAIKEQETALSGLRDREAEYTRALEDAERKRADSEALYTLRIEKANEALSNRKLLAEQQRVSNEERLALAHKIATIETATSEMLVQMLEGQRKEGETLSSVLDGILEKAGRLDDTEFKNLREWADAGFEQSKVAHLRVEADTAMAEAELQMLERDRVVRIHAHVASGFERIGDILDKLTDFRMPSGSAKGIKSWSEAFRGFIQAATGISAIKQFSSMLREGMTNMHGLALTSSIAHVAIGSLGGTLVATTALLASLSKGIIDVSKGGVLLPAAALAIGTGFFTAQRGVSTFINAAKGSGEALAELSMYSIEAAESANTLYESFAAADSFGKGRFFANMAAEVGRLGDTLQPMVRLWEESYAAMGLFFNGAARQLNLWSDSGRMAESMGLVAESLYLASGAGENLTATLIAMTDVGARRLPWLGQALTDVTGKYRKFIEQSAQSGAMDAWIDEAARQLVGFGNTVGGTIGIIDALGRAAKSAGIDGFVSLGNSMQAASRALNSPLYQTGLSSLFKGASEGAKAFGRGMAEMLRHVMMAGSALGDISREVGMTTGAFAKLSGVALTNTGVLGGIAELSRDINQGFRDSGNIVLNFSEAMGQGARVAGELFKAFMQVGEATTAFWASGEKLTAGLEAIIPVFARFMTDIVRMAHSMAAPVLDAVGQMLTAFSQLPPGIQNTVMALGLLTVAVRPLMALGAGNALLGLGRSIVSIGDSSTKASGSVGLLGSAFNAVRGSFDSFRLGWMEATGAMGRDGNLAAAQQKVRGLGDSMGAMGGGLAIASRSISSGFATIRSDADSTHSRVMLLRSGLSQIGHGVSTGGIVMATGALNGLKGALGGVVSALGGPVSIAIMGVVGILAHFAGKAAEAEQRVQTLKGTLTTMGSSTEATARAINDGLMGQWDDFSSGWNIAFLNFSKRIGEVAEATGRSSADIAKGLAEGSAEMETYRNNLRDIAAALAANTQAEEGAIGSTANLTDRQKELHAQLKGSSTVTKEMSRELFGVADAAGLTYGDLQGLTGVLDEWSASAQKAKDAQREYAESMNLTDAAGKQLRSSLETLGDTTATSTTKASAFREVLDVVNGGSRSLLEMTTSQGTAMANLAKSFQGVTDAGYSGAEVFSTYTNALGETSSRMNTARSEIQGLDNAMKSSFEQTTNLAQAAYDSTLKQTGSIRMATESASRVMSEWRSSAREQLLALGADAQQAEQYLNDLAGKPYMAEVIFMGKTEEFMEAQAAVQKAGKAFDGEAFTAFLKANPGTTKEDIQSLIKAGMTWSSSKYAATLALDGSDADAKLQEIISRGRQFSDSDFRAVLKGDEQPFLDAVIAAKMAGEDIEDKEWMARFGINADAFNKIKGQVLKDGEEFGSRTWMARMDMDNVGFAEKYYATEASLLGLTGQEWLAYIQSNVGEVKEAQEALYGNLQAMHGTSAEVSIVSNAATEAVVLEVYKGLLDDMDGRELQSRLRLNDEEWNTVIDALPGNWESKKVAIEGSPVGIEGDDRVSPKLDEIGAKVGTTFPNGVSVKIDADTDAFNSKIASASTLGQVFSNNEYSSTLNGRTGPWSDAIISANTMGQAFSGSTYAANLDGNNWKFVQGVESSSALGQLFGTSVYTGTLDGNPAPFADKAGSASTLGRLFASNNFQSTLDANDRPAKGNIASTTSRGDSYASTTFTGTLGANPNPANASINHVNVAGAGWGRSYNAGTLGATDAASGVIDRLFRLGASWARSVFTATLSAIKGNAHGSFVSANGRAFANGGFMPTLARSYAVGGITSGRHAPQIRYPQGSNITIWNEGAGRGNTGGESYIPHAIGKRSRSTQILGLTAREFGLSVVRYGEGGITHIGGVSPGVIGAAPALDPRALGNAVADATSRALEPLLSTNGSGEPNISLSITLDGRELRHQMKMLDRKYSR